MSPVSAPLVVFYHKLIALGSLYPSATYDTRELPPFSQCNTEKSSRAQSKTNGTNERNAPVYTNMPDES